MPLKTLIDADSLRRLLGQPQLAVIDCRFDLMNPAGGLEAYVKGHIPGARYADLNRDLSSPVTAHTGRHPLPAPDVFAARLGELGVGDDTQVVAYDDANSSMAARLWWMLRWLGHEAVAVLDGGFKAWVAAGGAVESGEAATRTARTARFTPRVDPRAVLSTADLERALQAGTHLLVDARAAERFAGSVEPIDPVAGHVPGAVNHPFTANLGADGRFLPAAELERRWRERLAGKNAGQLIAMCGSGVTACHHLLSLEAAGIPGGRLYAGSWSEWIRDPRRPVARG
ncbi:MAG TPA: sulfurtransferase [Steroidobacteraceae bacterium]|nr:sulfurtransferase [Steroidobacteraceae bacterium]